MGQVIKIALKLESTFDLGFILLATLTSLAALLESIEAHLAILVLIANLAYILPKIKREIGLRYGNSIKKYIKQFFAKKPNYDE